MGPFRKALVVGVVLGVGAGVGSALFVLVTPGEERIQAMLKVGAVWSLRWGERAGREPRVGDSDCEPLFLSAGDARAGPAERGRDRQEQTVSAGHSAGGSSHAGERGLEEELDGRQRQREVSVRQNLPQWALEPLLWRISPKRPFSCTGVVSSRPFSCTGLADNLGPGSCRWVSTFPANPALTMLSRPYRGTGRWDVVN